jgi:predicted PurR-regulated permease PerM
VKLAGMAMPKQVISISTGTIVKTVAILLLLGFLWLVRDIVIIVIFSMIFASAIDPLVDWLQRFKIPRALGVLVIYLLIIGIVAGVITLLVPPIAEQISALAQQLPEYFSGDRLNLFQRLEDFARNVEITESARDFFTSIGQTLSSSTGGVFATVSGFFGGVFSVVSIAVLTFYLTAEEKGIKKFFQAVVPTRQHSYVNDLVTRIQLKLGAWLRSYFLLGLIVAILIYIGLSVFRIDYALVLALLAGLLEFIPFIGPIVAIIPALFLALTQNPILAVVVLVLYIVVNQIESHLLVPRLLQRAIGLNPVVVVLVLLVGAKLAGIIGLLLAVPLTIALVEFGRDVFEERRFSSRSSTAS